MAWSIFTNGGGDPAAIQWAKSLLHAIGAPVTPANVQVVYDWEKSEGGGGINNPLNQGPDTVHKGLSTSGSQYGGGAANYASRAAGLQGAVDYLNMPNFRDIKQFLVAGNSGAARAAIIASPWAASHYGEGASFSQAPLPGNAQALATFKPSGGYSGSSGASSSAGTSAGSSGSSGSGLGQLAGNLVSGIFWERVMLILGGALLVLLGIVLVMEQSKTVRGATTDAIGAAVLA